LSVVVQRGTNVVIEQQKGEDKVRKAEIKQLEKNQKEQFKAAKAEQKRVLGHAKDGKPKDKEVVVAPVGGKAEVTPVEETERSIIPEPKQEPEKAEKSEKTEKTESGGLSRVLSIKFHKGHPKHKEPKGKEVAPVPAAKAAPAPTPTVVAVTGEKKSLDGGKRESEMEPPASPSSPVPATSKVKSWIRSHFHNRSRSKSSPAEVISPPSKEKENDKKGVTSVGSGEGFIGGVALARLSARSRGRGGGDIADADKRDVSSSVPDGKLLKVEDDSGDRHNSMREMALAGRAYLDKDDGDEKGESGRSAAVPPSPVPVPNPVFATIASPEPPATTTQSEAAAPIATKSINHEGVSSPNSEREDPMKRDQRSAVQKFANDWDTAITRDKREGRAGSVSTLSSTDLSDEADSEDENGEDKSRDSLDRFEEARSELDRPTEPPRAGDFEGGENNTSILDRPRPIATDLHNEHAVILTGGARARPVRATSPYRGSRFSENFEEV